MSESLTITTERVDDIPVLLAHMERMNLPQLLDQHFPTHGHWQGLSLGWVATIWLAHILSEADHRLNQVQGWAEQRLETLRGCSRQAVRSVDLCDDRLGDVLRALSQDERWAQVEAAVNGHLLRVYDLRPQRVRLDSTTASGYWQVSEDGLFQFGHSKDHRPDLPQIKVMLATLDPFGLPVATDVLSGQRADDPLYLPAIARVRESLGQRGLLYVGDCKMAALDTRAAIQAAEDYYLCPLSAKQVSAEQLAAYLAPVEGGRQALQPVRRLRLQGEEDLAEGYEQPMTLTAEVEGRTVTWVERRLVVRSLNAARAAEAALRTRLTQAHAAVLALNERGRGKRRLRDRTAAQQAVEAVLDRYAVAGLLRVQVAEQVQTYPVRPYGERPATTREERQVMITAQIDPSAVQQAVARLGWRVYATNQPADSLSLAQAVLAYREEYLVERSLGRLKGHPLSLTPMYLERQDHATGLVRLLALALRVLTLLEFVVRRRLDQAGHSLAGLYAGNPKRVTARPTAERLLQAFDHLTLTVIEGLPAMVRHLTPLSDLQHQILALLDFSPTIYTSLVANSPKLPLHLSEP